MNNPPAFPIVIDLGDGVKYQTGMTLRDYFAAKAMHGIVASCIENGFNDDLVSASSYRLADAMLKAREA